MKKKNARLTEAKPSAKRQALFITRSAIGRLALWGALPVKLFDWLGEQKAKVRHDKLR